MQRLIVSFASVTLPPFAVVTFFMIALKVELRVAECRKFKIVRSKVSTGNPPKEEHSAQNHLFLLRKLNALTVDGNDLTADGIDIKVEHPFEVFRGTVQVAIP